MKFEVYRRWLPEYGGEFVGMVTRVFPPPSHDERYGCNAAVGGGGEANHTAGSLKRKEKGLGKTV